METLDTKQAAQYLKLHPVTLANYRRENKGPKFYKKTKKVVYYKEDLDEWLQS